MFEGDGNLAALAQYEAQIEKAEANTALFEEEAEEYLKEIERLSSILKDIAKTYDVDCDYLQEHLYNASHVIY